VFQRDYILRLVSQLAKTLGTVISLKKAKRFDEAELAVAGAAKNLVGLDLETLLALPVDQIVTLFSPGGSLDAGKCLVVAELLVEHGEIRGLRGDEETAYGARIRALSLLLEVSGRESLERIPEPERYLARIESLTTALSNYPLVPAVQLKLVLHHERQGAFADAEDVLFELVDAGDEDAVAFGIGLYQRLLAKSDAELERGKLPREEVEDALSQLRARLPSPS
jgi:hypothetical protein